MRPLMSTLRRFSTSDTSLPSFLSSTPGRIDILHAESNDILFNLATEEYMYEHLNLVNPTLFIWRNTKTIIIGKHQNPWKECRVQMLEKDGVTLARRKSGGGCVY
jgi:lipoate-protein ligase A